MGGTCRSRCGKEKAGSEQGLRGWEDGREKVWERDSESGCNPRPGQGDKVATYESPR